MSKRLTVRIVNVIRKSPERLYVEELVRSMKWHKLSSESIAVNLNSTGQLDKGKFWTPRKISRIK